MTRRTVFCFGCIAFTSTVILVMWDCLRAFSFDYALVWETLVIVKYVSSIFILMKIWKPKAGYLGMMPPKRSCTTSGGHPETKWKCIASQWTCLLYTKDICQISILYSAQITVLLGPMWKYTCHHFQYTEEFPRWLSQMANKSTNK